MVRLESGVIRRLFRGRAIPGWLLVLWAITIEILDWWGRIELVKEKRWQASPNHRQVARLKEFEAALATHV